MFFSGIDKFSINRKLFVSFTILALLWSGFILFLGTQRPFAQFLRPAMDRVTTPEQLKIPFELEFWYGDTLVTTDNSYDFVNFVVRKTAHFVFYGILCLIITIQQLYYKNDPIRAFVIAFFIIGLLGGVDEFVQYLLPHRKGMILDVVLNMNGSAIALIWLIRRKSRNKERFYYNP